jgi:hypothetical protein
MEENHDPLGIIYLFLVWRGAHHHTHSHIDGQKISSKRTKFAVITSLSFAMFFSPCIETGDQIVACEKLANKFSLQSFP